jgi:hypothetical protein
MDNLPKYILIGGGVIAACNVFYMLVFGVLYIKNTVHSKSFKPV